MWVLDCDGDLFQNKRLWLKPGTKHLFGRTKKNQETTESGAWLIENKSVSRQHLTITVAPVTPNSGALLHAKSELTITDCSKLGTTLDGERFLKESKVLKGDEHEFRLGNYEPTFRIKWQPIVFTFGTLPRGTRHAPEPLADIRSRLEVFDIKAIHEYIAGHTTHVVANKRNTSKGLQALVSGKHIVSEAFLEGIIKVATRSPLQPDPENPVPAKLESDFEQYWPKEIDYVPNVAKEPKPRPAHMMAPDPARKSVFEGYTFLFCHHPQFESLMPPITDGGGKAIYYELALGQTTASDIVCRMRELSGNKGTGELPKPGGKGGVVLVRFPVDEGYGEWADELTNQVMLDADRRAIEQNEFLDAIVMNDASPLCKQLEGGDVVPSSGPQPKPRRPGAPQAPQIPEERSSSAGPATITAASKPVFRQPQRTDPPETKNLPRDPSPPKRRTRRAIAQSRFKGFDDFDPSQLATPELRGEDDRIEDVSESQPPARTGSGLVTSSQLSRPASQSNPHDALLPSRKRRSPLSLEPTINQDEMVKDLLPAATAMKRRKLEEERRNVNTISKDKPQGKVRGSSVELTRKSGRTKRKEKEIDVLALAREQREAEEAAARRDEESLREAMDGMDIEAMRNLVEIEEMDVEARSPRPSRSQPQSDCWDERWNGRKNFKGFRRKGKPAPMRGPKVIVGLEEVKKKDYGIGEEYWLESSGRSRPGISQSQSLGQPNEEDGAQVTLSASSGKKVIPESTQDDQSFIELEEAIASTRDPRVQEKVVPTRKTQGRAKTRSQTQSQTQSQAHTQTLRSETKRQSTVAKGKRPAPAMPPAKEPPAKRTRSALARLEEEDDDDDDDSGDELKFRFGGRRRTRRQAAAQ